MYGLDPTFTDWLQCLWWADFSVLCFSVFREVWGQPGHPSALQLLHQLLSVHPRSWSWLCQTQQKTRWVFTWRGTVRLLLLWVDALMRHCRLMHGALGPVSDSLIHQFVRQQTHPVRQHQGGLALSYVVLFIITFVGFKLFQSDMFVLLVFYWFNFFIFLFLCCRGQCVHALCICNEKMCALDLAGSYFLHIKHEIQAT